MKYRLKNHIRIVTATSLFDGHDVAINIMRRIMQQMGVEVVHIGHNRHAEEIVNCAIQEDAQAIAITSYQGGHLEFFKYIKDLFKEKDANHIKIFGGGGGTILPGEVDELHKYGINRIYTPKDGTELGLDGMVLDLVKQCDFNTLKFHDEKLVSGRSDFKTISGLISRAEIESNGIELKNIKTAPVLGITGTGGAGKSSVLDEFVKRLTDGFPDFKVAILSIDPTKRKSGGALLGDRIRMNAIDNPQIYMRSVATRQANLSLSKHIPEILHILQLSGFDLIILESSGIGQSDTEICDHADVSVYVMTPEYGAATQLEKIDMLDFANIIVINKFDKRGAKDAKKEVIKQYKRNHGLFDSDNNSIPVIGTIASRYEDRGTDDFFEITLRDLKKIDIKFSRKKRKRLVSNPIVIIPEHRIRYLSEIAESIKSYNCEVEVQADLASKLNALNISISIVNEDKRSKETNEALYAKYNDLKQNIDVELFDKLSNWQSLKETYQKEQFEYQVRNRKVIVKAQRETLSGINIPKVILPKFKDWGDIARWLMQENVPGKFPFTAGIFPFKRTNEDPTRMFAGEGTPEKTNRRFHYISKDQKAKRLSTAFDSVTLYGEDPHIRPDIFGKIGNSGVSVCCLDDVKKLYSGFDLADEFTSVSMTINGPASILCAYFLNAAIDQQCEKYIKSHGLDTLVEERLIAKYDENQLPRPAYNDKLPIGNDGLGTLLIGITGDEILEKEQYERIKKKTLGKVRGTVQSDILKEDQAQNTCIFSTDFSLRLMGDTQQYFVDNGIQNFYSVSISGYHIAEAGANPITQLAFTLANGFTYVEYYLSRGMQIDEFVPNFSFFFSNGIDPEYAVIGRVARRIWAKAMKLVYKANERSQKLKYHIQTSGRSLHAQEISFNDIRTTLQALYAIYDNCNSLHTNAYDEAITTPTEESVRRALGIQLIINNELGIAKNENPLQGSFIIEELTDLVEEAVLLEFDRLTERGGVLGAMERMYQRNKIQEESMYYEKLKHSGKYPIIGVNTYLNKEASSLELPGEVSRATDSEKKAQIENVEKFKKVNEKISNLHIEALKKAAANQKNMFEAIMETSKYCSLGQITNTLYQVGGKYRRNM